MIILFMIYARIMEVRRPINHDLPVHTLTHIEPSVNKRSHEPSEITWSALHYVSKPKNINNKLVIITFTKNI